MHGTTVSRKALVTAARQQQARACRRAIRPSCAVAADSNATELPGFRSKVYVRGKDHEFEWKRNQYAYSSHFEDGGMNPAAILIPDNPSDADADIVAAIQYASANGLAVAVRSGGHQYSGASSTAGRNIQIDVSNAYDQFEWDEASGLATVGVGVSLGKLNEMLGKHGLVVPMGQCAHVHAGGHSHTGGYGLSGRAFGLFADHIMEIRVITADGRIRVIPRGTSDPDEAALFYGVLGGSPGNYAILTQIKLKPHHDRDHPNAQGLKVFIPYIEIPNFFSGQKILKDLLKIKADMVADDSLPADYDYCVTVMSGGQRVLEKYGEPKHRIAEIFNASHRFDDLQEAIKFFRNISAEELNNIMQRVPVIIVFAQWANLGGKDQHYDPNAENNIIRKIKKVIPRFSRVIYSIQERATGHKLSDLAQGWGFQIQREFNMPYIKRTYVTNSKSLNTSGWIDMTVEQVNKVVNAEVDGVHLSMQLQHYGGTESRYRKNDPEDHTSYSFRREASVLHTIDCFYEPDANTDTWSKGFAMSWQRENDERFKGEKGVFSPGMDWRVLWGSYYATLAEKNMNNAWMYYYESYEKYLRLCEIKKQFDPKNVFTPNDFSVQTTPPPRPAAGNGQ